MAAVGCGDTMTTTFYGSSPVDDYDASADASDGASDTSSPMFDASYGGPPLDSGRDAGDGD
jgi:hypothetical protein